MNLLQQVQAAMFDDEEDRDKQSDILKSIYERANPEERAKLDEAFVALCGWSLDTLIERA